MSQTYHFTYEVKPRPNHPEYDKPGAYAEVFVVDESESSAEKRALHYLDEHLLDVTKKVAGGETTLEQYADKETGAQLFQKAQRFGLALGLGFWGRES